MSLRTLFNVISAALDIDGRPIIAAQAHDAGTDLDDEFAALVCTALHKQGLVDYALTVASYGPKEPRAQLMGGLTKRLDISTIAAVGVGTGTAPKVNAYEFDIPYLASTDEVDGSDALIRMAEYVENVGGRLFLISTADFTDTRNLIERLGDERAVQLIDRIVWMGGANFDEATGRWVHDPTAQNAKYDLEAAGFVFDWAQRHGVRLIVTTRHAAKAASIASGFYGQLPDREVAKTMDVRAASALRGLWTKVKLYEVDPETAKREYPKFPFERCDVPWFTKTFLCGNEPDSDIGFKDDIWPNVIASGGKFLPYDALAALAMFAPELPQFFAPAQRDGSSVMVIGASESEHNLVEPEVVVQLLTELAHRAFQD